MTKVTNIAIYIFNSKLYLKYWKSEIPLDNSIKRFAANSVVFAGYIDRLLNIWYVNIVINDDESIIKDNGTANIFAIIELRFKILKWYIFNGSIDISDIILIAKNPNMVINIFFKKVFIFKFLIFDII